MSTYCVEFNNEIHWFSTLKDAVDFIVLNYDPKPGDYLRISSDD